MTDSSRFPSDPSRHRRYKPGRAAPSVGPNPDSTEDSRGVSAPARIQVPEWLLSRTLPEGLSSAEVLQHIEARVTAIEQLVSDLAGQIRELR